MERPAWGAAQPRHRTAMTTAPKGIALHWVGVEVSPDRSPADLTQSIQRYHMKTRGWSDIAYQELVGLDGTALAGRGFGIRSAARMVLFVC